MTGQKNDLHPVVVFADPLCQLQAVHQRHLYVRQHDVGLNGMDFLLSVLPVDTDTGHVNPHILPTDEVPHHLQFQFLVVHQKNAVHVRKPPSYAAFPNRITVRLGSSLNCLLFDYSAYMQAN
ncbi:hypothetical protein D3C81_1039350 [compost metagenome]